MLRARPSALNLTFYRLGRIRFGGFGGRSTILVFHVKLGQYHHLRNLDSGRPSSLLWYFSRRFGNNGRPRCNGGSSVSGAGAGNFDGLVL